jgi:hypothetical protein
LRGTARKVWTRGNSLRRGRLHQNECGLQEQPIQPGSGSYGKHRGDGEYGEIQHGIHVVPPVERLSILHCRAHS